MQNFLALCASDYYNGCLFHRNIKGFIVQTGDPTHTGKGGNSIWGRKFEDEFKEDLKVCSHSESDLLLIVNCVFMMCCFCTYLECRRSSMDVIVSIHISITILHPCVIRDLFC